MRAVICTKYGPPEVLQMQEVRKPQPKDHEVLIKVYATSAHVGDTRIRKVDPFFVRFVFGLFRPRKNLILGMELAGVIESRGKNVTAFDEGDEVFAWAGYGLGGYAEYRCLPGTVKNGRFERKGLVGMKPSNLSFTEAATVPAAGLTVLQNFRKVKIGEGQHILINGASGSLGTYAIQLAKHYGAEVTAVCSSKNFDLVRSLGADHVIDYMQEDFTMGTSQYDIVYDAVMKSKAGKCKKILKPTGIFINNNRLPKIQAGDLSILKGLVERNTIRPVIDRVYSIEEIVDAHRYVDTGRKRGNVAVAVNQA